VNGALITSMGLPPFIVTLATMAVYRGLALDSTGGVPVNPDYTWTASARSAMDSLRTLQFGSFLGLPPNVWIAFGVVLVGVPLLHLTVLGRYAYAIGSNERTARLCGVHVDRYKTLCYVISGAAAGLAGVTMTAKFKAGQPAEFTGAELTVIAAVVIGGTSLFGGEGTIIGTVLGVLMLGLLYSGCVIADISTFKQFEFIGGTILLAAALDRFRHLRR
jgi:ribose transport system permease protein